MKVTPVGSIDGTDSGDAARCRSWSWRSANEVTRQAEFNRTRAISCVAQRSGNACSIRQRRNRTVFGGARAANLYRLESAHCGKFIGRPCASGLAAFCRPRPVTALCTESYRRRGGGYAILRLLLPGFSGFLHREFQRKPSGVLRRIEPASPHIRLDCAAYLKYRGSTSGTICYWRHR